MTYALAIGYAVTLRYVVASTAILGAAGILGVLLRDSQGDFGRLPAGWFYALMTAHGLGAFLGWAGFSVMGTANASYSITLPAAGTWGGIGVLWKK